MVFVVVTFTHNASLFQGLPGPSGPSGPPGSVGDPGERVSVSPVSKIWILRRVLDLLMYL